MASTKDMHSASQELPEDEEVSVNADAKEFVLLLISMYKDAPELWDSKRKCYLDKNKKNISLNRITNNLKKLDRHFTVEKLKRKINTLRSNFNREHAKMKKSLRSAMSRDDVYRPKLWYYNEMLFITDSTEIAPTEDSMQNITEATVKLPSGITNTTRKKQNMTQNDESLATNYFNRAESDTDIIAKSWAMKLNRLDALQRCFAEKIINDVLFEGAMGTLTRDGVIFISAASNTPIANMSRSPSPYSINPYIESVSSQSMPKSSPCLSPSTTSCPTKDSKIFQIAAPCGSYSPIP